MMGVQVGVAGVNECHIGEVSAMEYSIWYGTTLASHIVRRQIMKALEGFVSSESRSWSCGAKDGVRIAVGRTVG
jgi:hypothetical protein